MLATTGCAGVLSLGDDGGTDGGRLLELCEQGNLPEISIGLGGILAIAILSPFAMRGIWTGLVAIAIILAAGFYSAEWMTGFLL